MNYQRFVCEGFLKKYAQKSKFWQIEKGQYLRYFSLDHKLQVMKISQDSQNLGTKLIRYTNIKAVAEEEAPESAK